MKYLDVQVVFREIPDEIALAINITNCPFKCKGCHSPELWQDIGDELTFEEMDRLIALHPGITCVCLMGGGAFEIWDMCDYIHERYPNLKFAWYTGMEWIDLYNLGISHQMHKLDYVKFGPYKEECGPLNSPTTNQVVFKREKNGSMTNITSRYWNR